jgi:hypothetical protein
MTARSVAFDKSIERATGAFAEDLARWRPPTSDAEREFLRCTAEMAAWTMAWSKEAKEGGATPEILKHLKASLVQLRRALNYFGAARCRFSLVALCMMDAAQVVEAIETLGPAEGSA